MSEPKDSPESLVLGDEATERLSADEPTERLLGDEAMERMLAALPELHHADGRLFDSSAARANSCYSGPPKLHASDDKEGRRLMRIVPPTALYPDEHDRLITPQGETAHDMLRAHILSEYYPCVGAKSAFKHNTYRFGFYKELGNLTSVAALGRNLRRFVAEYEQLGDFTTFVAVFKDPQLTTEAQFEKLLWKQLQLLHDHDGTDWDPNYSSDPESGTFAFSFAGKSFFIVGMHTGASRFSRRFAYPALIFNPESQILRLKEAGLLDRFAHTVRDRDTLYQGGINPSLPERADTTGGEARVYSGKTHDGTDGWKCPFRPKVTPQGETKTEK